jgi:hypothetical protein
MSKFGLFGFRFAKAVYLDSCVWTADNALLTLTFKIRRKAQTDKDRRQIDDLYRQYDETH